MGKSGAPLLQAVRHRVTVGAIGVNSTRIHGSAEIALKVNDIKSKSSLARSYHFNHSNVLEYNQMVDWGRDISMLSLTISKMSKKFAFNWTLGRRPKDLNVATGQREFRSGGIFPLSPEATDCGHHHTSYCQSRQALLLRGISAAPLCPQCIRVSLMI